MPDTELLDSSRTRSLFDECHCGGQIVTTRGSIDDGQGEIKCSECGQKYELSPIK